MTNEDLDITWLDGHQTLSFNDLLALSGLSQRELITLVEQGALLISSINTVQNDPINLIVDQDTNTWIFGSQSLMSIRTLCRLKADFELEDNALSLILVYLERIRLLEAQLQQLSLQK